MLKNFNEKSFSEKTIRILTILTLIIGIPVAIKTCLEKKETNPKSDIITTGNNSTVINGNGNTYNKNNYIINSQNNNKNNPISSIKKEKNISNAKQLNVGKTKIVILPYEYLSDDIKYQWLSKGFSETLIEPILNTEKYTVLEGTLRDKVINEINFQQGKYVDIKSAVKIGKMLGANEIVIGSYQVHENKIMIFSRIVDVETSKIIDNSSINFEDSILDPFKMQKNYSDFFVKKLY